MAMSLVVSTARLGLNRILHHHFVCPPYLARIEITMCLKKLNRNTQQMLHQ